MEGPHPVQVQRCLSTGCRCSESKFDVWTGYLVKLNANKTAADLSEPQSICLNSSHSISSHVLLILGTDARRDPRGLVSRSSGHGFLLLP